ncbi:MAG: 4-alpha-glucanotransferase [Planctomycetota bacterium]|nr:MAG: 4-alpha-glucanotransferase [Planctomycetota bacterium]
MSTKPSKGNRSAGIILHPTSLPGPYGIGDLGPAAYAWTDTLARARITWWQVLPLGPTGFGDSPYQSFSAFAGNPYLVSPDALIQDGLLARSDVDGVSFPADHVNYGPVIQFKVKILARAWENFQAGHAPGLRQQVEAFAARNASWLDDFALYMALKDAHGGASWQSWPRELVVRQPAALKRAQQDLATALGLHKFRQFLFFRQWQALKQYANSKGIKLIGDVPIFVASDSADVWHNPELFFLDERRQPTVVAGVPPDYFSATGQLWGNPLYNWEALRKTGYAWWVARMRATLELIDLVRLDHFRGFEAYWEVPAGRPTAQEGRWVKGPGADLFETLRARLGGLPLLAEDLGLITEEVEALRAKLRLPGMRVLQFAFGGATEDRFLPHNYERNTVVYTGTHDNDTTVGWYNALQEHERRFLRRYLGKDSHEVAWDLIRVAWSSVADYALAPLQDVVSLGTEARMNFPGRPSGNWSWRFTPQMLSQGVLDRLADLTEVYWR